MTLIIDLAKHLAHLLREDSGSESRGSWSGLHSCHRSNLGGLMVPCFTGIFIFAAVPQCGRSQPPLAEPVQESISQSAQPFEPEPEVVVSELLEAMENNDAEKIRSLFDPNASQAYGDGAAKSGDAFFRWLDSDIIQREGRVENAQLEVNGNEVVVTGQYQSIGYTSNANFLLTVENGYIVSWRMRY